MQTTKYKLFSFIMAACFLFLVLTSLAMVYYPGGTRSTPETKGYLFFENFFSELGLSRTYTGGPNNVSFLLFTAALALAGLALTLYFIISPSLFWDSRITRVLSLFGTFFGIISGLSFIGVAFTPADLYLEPHQLFVQLAFTTFFVAVVFYALAILLNRSYPNLYALVNITFGALLGAYIWLLFFGPSTNTSSGLVIQVAGQKIIAYAAIISVLIQAYGSRSMVVIQSEEKRTEKLSNQISTAS
ncbi:hypothetical protein ACFLY4_06880 [Chloroflexota bacterium]